MIVKDDDDRGEFRECREARKGGDGVGGGAGVKREDTSISLLETFCGQYGWADTINIHAYLSWLTMNI